MQKPEAQKPDEYRIRQPGITKEEWEGGHIPGHSSSGVVSRAKGETWPKGNERVTPGAEPPPRFSLRLTPDELWQLGQCAYEQGLTMPQLVRRLILQELARHEAE